MVVIKNTIEKRTMVSTKWRWIITLISLVIILILGYSIFLPKQTYAQQDQPRLERLTQLGGSINAAIFDSTDALIAEGESLVRMPLLGTNAYQPSDRLPLNYGVIQDLLQTPQVIYAITDSHIVILDITGHSILKVYNGGGERLNYWEDKLVVETREAGIRLYSIMSDGTLLLQSQISAASQLQGSTFLNGNLLATADQFAGLRVFNIEDAAQPLSIGTLQGITPINGVTSFAQWLFVTNQHRVHIVNTRNPEEPSIIGHYAPIQDVQDIQRLNDYLLIADKVDGLKIYEQSQADQFPRYLGGQIATSAYHVAVDPTQQWIISTHQDGIYFYDVSQLPNFLPVSFVPLWTQPTGVSFINGQPLALISVGTGGAAIVDFSIPESPRVVAALPFSGPVEEIRAHPIYTNLLYITLGDGQLLTISINPNNPAITTVFSEIPLSGQPDDMAIDPDGRLLAVSTGRSGLNVYTLFPDPTQPRMIAELAAKSRQTAGVTQIEYVNDDLWIALNGQTLQLLSIHNRTLRLLDEIEVLGNHLAVNNAGRISISGQNQLTTLLIEDNRLRKQSIYHAPASYNDIQAILGQVILASDDPDAGLVILDINNPTNPIEQRFVSTMSPVENFVLNGDDILLTHLISGLTHIRFPLSMATLAENQPQIAGIYHPSQSMRQLSLGQNDTMYAFGQSMYQWDMSTSKLFEIPPHQVIDGIFLDNGAILLDENLNLVRINELGQQVAQNSNLRGVKIASDGQQVWLLSIDGQLYTLDLITLESTEPAYDLGLSTSPTTMLYEDNQLLIGTQGGDLLVFDPLTQSISNLFEANSPILSLTGFPQTSNQILFTTHAGDLWWLDRSNSDSVQTIAHYHTQSPILTSSVDPTEQWIGLGTEICGLQVLDAHSAQAGLNLYAQLPDLPITDLHFSDEYIYALTAGVPTIYQFNVDGMPLQPETPHHPAPQSMAEASSPVQSLTWQSSTTPCFSVDYEVWINGQLMGTTQSAQWTFPSPPEKDFRWQVVAIDTYGNRAVSPEWQVYLPISGWVVDTPSFDNMRRLGEPQTATMSPPIWLFGFVLTGMGLLALGTLVRRVLLGKT